MSEPTREQRRSRRKRETRARTISVKRLSKRSLTVLAVEYPVDPAATFRPKTRGQCELVNRPCPFVSCRFHLYLDVSPTTGAIKVNFPDLEVEELPESCALDAADLGGLALEDVAEMMNMTRERVRQVEVVAFEKIERARQLAAHAEGDRDETKRRSLHWALKGETAA